MARSLTGTVTSNKADKTIVVSVHIHKTHPLYKKAYSVTNKFIAHDENNQAEVGDKVTITETRPISARKRFILKSIDDKAAISEDLKVEKVTAEPEPETTEEAK